MDYDLTKLIRDPNIIGKYTKVTNDGQWVTTKEMHLIFPVSWVGKELAWIEGAIRVLTKFMVVIEDRYTVCNECAYMPLTPDSISKTIIEKIDHFDFMFQKGAVISPNLDLVVNDNILYYIFDEMITKSRCPVYFTYEDLSKIYLNSNYHTNKTVTANNSLMEMIVAKISRTETDGNLQWRYKGKTMADAIRNPPVYIEFRSPVYMASGTLAKIAGAYFDDGLTSALTTENHGVEPLEALVRS